MDVGTTMLNLNGMHIHSKNCTKYSKIQKKLDKVFKAHENSKLLKHEVMNSNVYSSASRLDPHKNGPYLS